MAMPDKMTARYFRKYAFDVPVVIDVGVEAGTPFLYESFPDAQFLLIDPNPDFPRRVAAGWQGRIRYDTKVAALSDQRGHLTMEVTPGRPSLATVGARLSAADSTQSIQVPCLPLDDLTEGLAGPFGLKIDTEGHELDVLRGAVRTLTRCDFVIAEVSIKRRFEGGYRFSEVIAFMAAQGFEVHSFLSGLTRAPRMSDVLFVPADSPRFDTKARDQRC